MKICFAGTNSIETRFPDVTFSNRKINKMDKDRAAGSATQVKGVVKEAAGKATGDAKLQADGKSGKAAGKVQNAVGGLKDVIHEEAIRRK